MLPGPWLGTPGLGFRSATERHSVILPPSVPAFPQQLSSLLFRLSWGAMQRQGPYLGWFYLMEP